MNQSKLLKLNPHESPNPLDLSLAQSFSLCQPQLKPPFPLTIPSPRQYTHLNFALIYGTLTEPNLAKTHLTHLHAVVADGYKLFTSTLVHLAGQNYSKLLETPRAQLIWVTSQLVTVSAVKVDALLISLLRQIAGGDFSEPNLWLCARLLEILDKNWDWLVGVGGGASLDKLKRMEVEFCVMALKQCFGLCMEFGQELVRLLQDLVCIPEFKQVWKDF